MATVQTFPFELVGADGGPLRGEVRVQGRAEQRPGVVICHGFKGFKDWGFFPHVAQRLAHAGFAVATFNFSSSGVGPDGESFSEPGRFGRGTPTRDQRDLAQVWDTFRNGALVDGMRVPGRMGVFGHSRGGAAAIVHAAARSECRALVTWAAISSYYRWGRETVRKWRAEGKVDIVNARTGEVLPLFTDYLDDIEAHGDALDPVAAAPHVTAPWLIVQGSVDEAVKTHEAEQLLEAADSDRTRLVVIDGGSHTLGARHPWAGTTPQFDRAMEATVEWFARHLL
ncbi:MAG: alpha/beta hydrolase [Gemmatimonadales bacterium]|nr:alpha/beta hydrolase [Gemmatimonadales bacterium]